MTGRREKKSSLKKHTRKTNVIIFSAVIMISITVTVKEEEEEKTHPHLMSLMALEHIFGTRCAMEIEIY